MSKVLIVSKTKMQNNNVCVSGWDYEKKQSVRLLNKNGFHETIDECPYSILEVWSIDYRSIQQRPLPHTEDVAVISRSMEGMLKPDIHLIDFLQETGAQIYSGDIFSVFDGKLRMTNSGSLYINHESCPVHSTCFWVCDRNIVRKDFDNKIRYNYNNGTSKFGYTIKFVGLDHDPVAIIPKGTLVRLSLAHWWKPEDSDDEERCYLQLSGYYL